MMGILNAGRLNSESELYLQDHFVSLVLSDVSGSGQINFNVCIMTSTALFDQTQSTKKDSKMGRKMS